MFDFTTRRRRMTYATFSPAVFQANLQTPLFPLYRARVSCWARALHFLATFKAQASDIVIVYPAILIVSSHSHALKHFKTFLDRLERT